VRPGVPLVKQTVSLLRLWVVAHLNDLRPQQTNSLLYTARLQPFTQRITCTTEQFDKTLIVAQ
jgi:hypothetical protein